MKEPGLKTWARSKAGLEDRKYTKRDPADVESRRKIARAMSDKARDDKGRFASK
ncbi:MAG: hypothetical protein PVSMB8_00120 [Vulcanimicrobiaceae bacterium]